MAKQLEVVVLEVGFGEADDDRGAAVLRRPGDTFEEI
jgi:hypothetical protein